MEYEFPAIAIQAPAIGNIDDLASSRPIPLSALSGRTKSRNKGTKAWKPLQLSDLELGDTGGHASTRISEAGQCNTRSGLTALHPFASDDGIMIHRQEDPIPLSHNHSHEQSLADVREQEWMEDSNASVHRNPLSYSSGYESLSRHSIPQEQEYKYEGPFLKNESCVYMEYPSLLTNNASMLTGKSSLNGMQKNYGQGFLSERSMLKPYYVHPGLTPYMSQYEMLPHEAHDTSQVILNAPAQTQEYPLQAPSHESYNDHRRMSSDDTRFNVNGQVLSILEGKAPPEHATQVQGPNTTVTRASIAGRCSKAIEIKPPNSTSRDVPKPSKKSTSDEQLRETLKRMVREKIEDEKKREAEKTKYKGVHLPDPFVEAERSTKSACLKQGQQADSHRAPMRITQAVAKELPNEPGMESSTHCKNKATKERSSTRCAPSVFEAFAKKAPKELEMKWVTLRKTSAAREDLRVLCNSSDPEPWELEDSKGKQGPITRNKILPRDTLREVASLTRRDVNEEEHASRMDAILAETENWFHADNRRNEPLQLQIGRIADEFAENQPEVADIERTKQTTELLGGVILNLHAYISDDRKSQGAYFANFGTVPARCCEPSHGGRRSYFDCDPPDGQYTIGRAFPVAGRMPERRLVLYGHSRLPLTMPDAWGVRRGF